LIVRRDYMKCWQSDFTILSIFFLVVVTAVGQDKTTLWGFTPGHSKAERELEEKFIALPDPERARSAHKSLTAEPHIAGSSADRRTAEYVLQQFLSYGIQAEIETFNAVLSEPREIKFELLSPVKFSGPTPEYVAEDPISSNRDNPTAFNAYSGSGDAVGPVVYANYGLPADYQFLRSKGISTAGKIVIVRYGACYRGVKARVAEENSAAGLLIFSDPQDDGYHAGDPYPKGPWRPASGVQRGSVLYEFITPGTVAADGSNVPHLPVMPLSYSDAAHILESLQGASAPPEWQGGLPFTYHIGLGPATVRMRVRMNQVERPIWNVIAKVRGLQDPEEIVLVGNHRDAWAYGGVDPNSGTTSILEMARSLGALLHEGWRPRRSIWLCSWDGEEMGEFGSVAWAQKHSEDLTRAAVAYLNVDYSVAGDRFFASAVPSLKKLLSEVASDVQDPAGGSVLDRANKRLREALWRKLEPGHAAESGAEPKSIERQEFEPGNPGGGTDYIAFLNHLGVPSADMRFDGSYGVYHSIFDNHRWMEEFGDPTFAYHITMARLLGLMTLRLTEADILPLDYETYGQEIKTYLEGIRNKMALLGQTGRFDFEPAQQAAEKLIQAARTLHERCRPELSEKIQPPSFYDVNRILVKVEQSFLLTDGLPGRPWYKHAVYAPGIYSGYEPVALPGIRETADAMAFAEIQSQIEKLTAALDRAADLLESVR
jgi:N-acetylated-alpha-linked acidic dipeptidase